MKISEWNVRDLEDDDSCIFSFTNIVEEDIIYYLQIVQDYILQLELGDYSVIFYSIIEFFEYDDKDLDIITDFPYSKFNELNPDFQGAIQIRFKISNLPMTYNILYAYEDSKDGKLVLRCKIPDNVFFYIDELNRYLSQFGRYRVDSFWLAHSKELAYDFKTTLFYKKYIEKSQ